MRIVEGCVSQAYLLEFRFADGSQQKRRRRMAMASSSNNVGDVTPAMKEDEEGVRGVLQGGNNLGGFLHQVHTPATLAVVSVLSGGALACTLQTVLLVSHPPVAVRTLAMLGNGTRASRGLAAKLLR